MQHVVIVLHIYLFVLQRKVFENEMYHNIN